MNRFYSTIALLLFLSLSVSAQYSSRREMRGVWVATVANIDWPSKPGLTVAEQQQEFDNLIRVFKEYKLNTIVFQIRPCADAFYASALEPWSRWLNGEQGKAPDPFYDPLDYAIKKCRTEGMDIHVWLNPYRALADTSQTVTSDHLLKRHPEWFLTYGKTVYFNPGLQETRDFVARVASDIVRRYDIDAVHMDDYFYPYRIANVEFPDDSTFRANPNGFSADRKDDWRRNNVDLIIKQIHDSIKVIKPWVEFGISPFGVWRNADKDSTGSATRAGQTNYDDLYADILKWQKEGWIDYVTPQLYWERGMKVANYTVLADWWSKNSYGCQVYIGQAPYRLSHKSKNKSWRRAGEITGQIKLNRTYPNIMGSMYFSGKSFIKDPLRLKEKLNRSLYKYPALTPVNNRITPINPEKPLNAAISREGDNVTLNWTKGTSTKNFIVYRFRKGKTADMGNPANIFAVTSSTSVTFKKERKNDPEKYMYVVTSQSYTNMESEPVYFK
ncbi:MAG TPA: family 10 glycosylhydrolase [Bacteroidales bacterium]|nr:family 10 glycosylhydrolase [Bacteroidales bacterium]